MTQLKLLKKLLSKTVFWRRYVKELFALMLNQLTAIELTDKDISWLIKGTAGHFTGMRAIDFIQLCHQDLLQLYRWGNSSGMVATQLFNHAKGKELKVMLMSGEGIVSRRQQFYDDIYKIASELKCKFITFDTNRRGLGLLAQKLGCKEQTRTYILNIGEQK